MLLLLPRLGLLGGDQTDGEGFEFALGVMTLSVEEPQSRDQRRDMGAGGLDSSRREERWRHAQGLQDHRT
jgi:hypothetical protein